MRGALLSVALPHYAQEKLPVERGTDLSLLPRDELDELQATCSELSGKVESTRMTLEYEKMKSDNEWRHQVCAPLLCRARNAFVSVVTLVACPSSIHRRLRSRLRGIPSAVARASSTAGLLGSFLWYWPGQKIGFG